MRAVAAHTCAYMQVNAHLCALVGVLRFAIV